MQRIINFILRYRNAFLYGFLVLLSLVMTINAHSYHQSKFFNSSKWLSGTVYGWGSDISAYFGLREENRKLVEENLQLRLLLFNTQEDSIPPLDPSMGDFGVMAARLVKNSIASPRNYLTVDKGSNQGVEQDMGVITTNGILGIVENVSKNYSTVQSVLNTKSNINAKIKNSDYFGSLIWKTQDHTTVQLIDIPRLVPLVVGDTIVTGGMSSIFPESIPIGTIKKYELNPSRTFYNIEVELFNDMANIRTVYLISNRDREEIKGLQERTLNE